MDFFLSIPHFFTWAVGVVTGGNRLKFRTGTDKRIDIICTKTY